VIDRKALVGGSRKAMRDLNELKDRGFVVGLIARIPPNLSHGAAWGVGDLNDPKVNKYCDNTPTIFAADRRRLLQDPRQSPRLNQIVQQRCQSGIDNESFWMAR
jgi:hypothetical protein